MQVQHMQSMNEKSRKNVWNSQSFKDDASVFYNRWEKLKKMCEVADKKLKTVLSIASEWNSNEVSEDEKDKILRKYKESVQP